MKIFIKLIIIIISEDEVQPRELARPSLSDSDDENVEINLQKSEVITLPSGQKIEKFKNEPLEAVKERIEHIIKALSDWNKYGDKTKFVFIYFIFYIIYNYHKSAVGLEQVRG